MSCVGDFVLAMFADGQVEKFNRENLAVTSAVPPQTLEACKDDEYDESTLGLGERSIQLLGRALVWLHADVYAEFDIMRELLAPDACMFGAEGADNAIKFKQKWLDPSALNYDITAIHQLDIENNVAVVDFDCMIPGHVGRGTDIVQFTRSLKVSGVDAIRHQAVGQNK